MCIYTNINQLNFDILKWNVLIPYEGSCTSKQYMHKIINQWEDYCTIKENLLVCLFD